MWHKGLVTLLLGCSVALSGCASQQGPNEQSGMVIGTIIGGVVGSHVGKGDGRTAAIIVGAVIGSAIGGNVGRSMDDQDRIKTGHTLETVRTGVPSTWRNPDSGNEYTVVPTRTYESSAGPCREYTIDAVVGGRDEKVYGTACRRSDGSWEVER